MQFELLYGLSCEFKTKETNIKNLRLMEIFRRFGRIPGPLPLHDVKKKLDPDGPTKRGASFIGSIEHELVCLRPGNRQTNNH